MISSNDLSPRAMQTRQHIYDTAITLFKEQGYDQTTIREIAAAADISIGLTYRYFAQKEDIVMALYYNHLTELVDYIESVAPGQLADRYHDVLRQTIQTLTPYRIPLMALFGAAMRPDSGLSLMGTDNNPLSRQLSEGYHQLVLGSEDALREPKAMQMGVALYTFHMLILLFWLYDRSAEQRATYKVIAFVHDLFKMIRPMFILPAIPQAIAKLSEIIMPSPKTESGI